MLDAPGEKILKMLSVLLFCQLLVKNVMRQTASNVLVKQAMDERATACVHLSN